MEIIFREDVLALGERYGLGEFVRYHQGPTLATTIRRMTRTSVVTAIFLILFALYYIIIKDTSHILAYPLSYFLSHLSGCIPMWVGLMAIILVAQSRKRNRIYEFTGGIIEVKKKKVIHIIPWNHMAALTYKRPETLFGLPFYSITMLNGKHYTLHCETIIPSIEQAILRRELPGVFARYKAGETLSFGSIGVNKEGITRSIQANKKAVQNNQSLKWSEVRQCVSEGHTLVNVANAAHDQPFRISLYGISNAGVLRELLAYITSPIIVVE